MKEYIERDAAIRTAIQAVTAYSLQITGNGITQFDGVDVANRMEMIPVADVVERVRGEWIYHECVSSYDGTISGYSCSACNAFVNEEIFDSDEFHKEFCGNCGSDMRGESDED